MAEIELWNPIRPVNIGPDTICSAAECERRGIAYCVWWHQTSGSLYREQVCRFHKAALTGRAMMLPLTNPPNLSDIARALEAEIARRNRPQQQYYGGGLYFGSATSTTGGFTVYFR